MQRHMPGLDIFMTYGTIQYLVVVGRLAQLVRALARQARGHWFESSIAQWHFSLGNKVLAALLTFSCMGY